MKVLFLEKGFLLKLLQENELQVKHGYPESRLP